uniref:Uncharacterized protein n=1 Tax=Anguilla anguilla TaxID=7936 RepID=A0A0E9TKI8_ANGAN
MFVLLKNPSLAHKQFIWKVRSFRKHNGDVTRWSKFLACAILPSYFHGEC